MTECRRVRACGGKVARPRQRRTQLWPPCECALSCEPSACGHICSSLKPPLHIRGLEQSSLLRRTVEILKKGLYMYSSCNKWVARFSVLAKFGSLLLASRTLYFLVEFVLRAVEIFDFRELLTGRLCCLMSDFRRLIMFSILFVRHRG